jgi:uncharacterized protein
MTGSVGQPLPPAVNPYDAPAVPVAAEPVMSGPHVAPRPRIWTVIVALVVAFGAVIVGQIAGITALVLWHFAQGGTPHNLQTELLDLVTQPAMFMGLALLGQIAIGGTALVAGWLSPQPLARRLGLVRPTVPAMHVAVLIAGALAPFALGMSLAYALTEVIEPDPSVAAMYEKMTLEMAVPFLLFIALAPGFFEELLFRGYIQRRLAQRWNSWVAVMVTSFVFAVFHVAPHTVVFAFPVGIWLGLLAWKTGSIWPGILCHALINGLWNVWQLGVQFEFFAEQPPLFLLVLLAVVGVAAFGASLWLMFWRPAAATVAA